MKIKKGKNTERKTNKQKHTQKNSLFKRFRHSFAQGIYGVVADSIIIYILRNTHQKAMS